MKRLFIFLSFFLISESFANIQRPRFELRPTLKGEFVSLASKAKDFHKIIQEGGNKESLEKESLATNQIISKLYAQVSSIPHLHQRLHSYKLLQSIEENLEVLKSQGINNKKVIKTFFTSFFEMVEVYNLKKDIVGKIFYCSKDKSTWFQVGNKPRNPINPDLKNCGKRL